METSIDLPNHLRYEPPSGLRGQRCAVYELNENDRYAMSRSAPTLIATIDDRETFNLVANQANTALSVEIQRRIRKPVVTVCIAGGASQPLGALMRATWSHRRPEHLSPRVFGRRLRYRGVVVRCGASDSKHAHSGGSSSAAVAVTGIMRDVGGLVMGTVAEHRHGSKREKVPHSQVVQCCQAPVVCCGC